MSSTGTGTNTDTTAIATTTVTTTATEAPRAVTGVVVSGGALKALSAIGVFRYLETSGARAVAFAPRREMTFVGTSAGTVIALMLALGCTSVTMRDAVADGLIRGRVTFDVNEVFECLSTFGLNSGSAITEFAENVLLTALGRRDFTFAQLHAATGGTTFAVCVVDVVSGKREFWDHRTAPDVQVSLGVRASCGIPLLFTPVVLGPGVYVDGGLLDNLPVDYFSADELPSVLAIEFVEERRLRPRPSDGNFVDYVHALIDVLLTTSASRRDQVVAGARVTVAVEGRSWIEADEEDGLALALTAEYLERMIETGFEAAERTWGAAA